MNRTIPKNEKQKNHTREGMKIVLWVVLGMVGLTLLVGLPLTKWLS